ncbi:hypothetical protein TWF696_005648 [Orbilia brochopaga]|uniref:MFS general substrate transporter n=1 Tax=Orbilia brochopaga TaxID=3140254 RepID=A0AAV9V813_9PEZI
MIQPNSGNRLSFVEKPDLESQRRASEQEEEEPLWPQGWRPYACLVGCFFLMFNSWGIVNGYGTYLSYYRESLFARFDIVDFNLIGSTQCFFILFLSFVAGRLLDANYSRWMLVGGSVLLLLGMFSLSLANGAGEMNDGRFFYTWIAQGLVAGLGMACFFVASSQIAATWFKRKKGFAIGIVACGASISGLVYPTMLRFMIDIVGFDRSVQIVASLIAVTCLISIFLAVPNPNHHFRKPSDWLATRTWVDTSAFRDPAFCWFTGAICWMFFGFYCVFFNLEEWAAKTGVGYKTTPQPGQRSLRTYWLLAIMNGSSTIGRLSSSYLCDHFGALNVHMFVSLVSSLLCLFLWTFANTLESALAFVIIFGAFSGSVIGLPPASMAAILGPDKSQQAKLGQWTGMMYTISSFFALTGPVIASHLVIKFHSFHTVQIWSGLCLFFSACCMGIAIIYHSRDEESVARIRRMTAKLTPSSTRSRSMSRSTSQRRPSDMA